MDCFADFYSFENFHIRIPFCDFEEFEAIKAALIDKGGFSEADGVLTKSASHAAIEQTIENPVTVAKNFNK